MSLRLGIVCRNTQHVKYIYIYIYICNDTYIYIYIYSYIYIYVSGVWGESNWEIVSCRVCVRAVYPRSDQRSCPQVPPNRRHRAAPVRTHCIWHWYIPNMSESNSGPQLGPGRPRAGQKRSPGRQTGQKRRLFKAPTYNTKPQQILQRYKKTIQSPDRLYKTPKELYKDIKY